MKGFVKNVSSKWMYAMKRSIKPGGQVELEELYEQYGKKYDMKFDDNFIDWLKNIKLKNADVWKIVYDFTDNVLKDIHVVEEKEISDAEREGQSSHLSAKKLEVSDVVNLTVRYAREIIPKVTDLTLLKYSLSEAKQLSNKDSLCKILQKRVKELQIAR